MKTRSKIAALVLAGLALTGVAAPAHAGETFGWDPRKQVCSWLPAICR